MALTCIVSSSWLEWKVLMFQLFLVCHWQDRSWWITWQTWMDCPRLLMVWSCTKYEYTFSPMTDIQAISAYLRDFLSHLNRYSHQWNAFVRVFYLTCRSLLPSALPEIAAFMSSYLLNRWWSEHVTCTSMHTKVLIFINFHIIRTAYTHAQCKRFMQVHYCHRLVQWSTPAVTSRSITE